MKHSFFEDLLLFRDEGESLSFQDASILDEHLSTCESCRQLSASCRDVERTLKHVPSVSPRPGFTSRFQTRLEAQRKRTHVFQTALILAGCTIGAGLILLALLYLASPWLRSPGMIFWAWLYRTVLVFNYAGVLQDYMITAFRSANLTIPLYAWFLLVGAITEIAVLWVVSYRYILSPRRVHR